MEEGGYAADKPIAQYFIAQYRSTEQRLRADPDADDAFVVVALLEVLEGQIRLRVQWVENGLSARGFVLGRADGSEERFEDWFAFDQDRIEAYRMIAWQRSGVRIRPSGDPIPLSERDWPPIELEAAEVLEFTQLRMILGDDSETPWEPLFIDQAVRDWTATSNEGGSSDGA